ncbi:hypothetical protein EU527_01685 [Candidatus Thorarchaeota archaeon]|nr:MAG: hypothetical protein EU527_01685 [Candidatus Thorarchaeota archaeon]
MLRQRRILLKVLILVPLATIFAGFALGPAGLVSYSPATRVGVHSVLAFWISMSAALVLLAYQKLRSRPHIVLMSALLFSIVLHIGSAGKNLLDLSQPVDRVLTNTVADLLDLALFGILIGGASVCYYRQSTLNKVIPIPQILVLLLLLLPFVVYAIMWFFVLPVLTQAALFTLGNLLAAIAIAGLTLASTLATKLRTRNLPLDRGYFITAMLLFVISTIFLLFTLPSPSMGWEYPETIQMAGFLVFCLALSVPFLRNSGFTLRGSYAFSILLIIIAYFPFLITIAIESMSLNVIIEPLNLLAYSIIHTGAGSLAGMMAILLYIYPKKMTSWNHYPLILLFGLWASVTLILLFNITIPFFAPLGEPITPYTVGSLLTLALLFLAIYWTTNPPSEDRKPPSIFQLSLVLAGMVSLIVIGEVINQITLRVNPELIDSAIGSIIILCTNLVIMFAFAHLIFLLSARSRGVITLELYVIIFLAMWTLPNILKSYYSLWESGWWVSEIYLFAGLLAGPPLLAILYIRALHEIEKSHEKASIYADLLMHDITNFNQILLTSFELLSSDDVKSEQRTTIADNGCNIISAAGQLISNVRLLSETDRLKQIQLTPTNLVATIVKALDIFSKRVTTGELVVEFKPDTSDAVVMANELIVNIFLNILYNVLECNIAGDSVLINMNNVEWNNTEYWQIDFITPCCIEVSNKTYSSSILGILASRTITESLNGHFNIRESRIDDMSVEKIFSVRLPVVK